MCSFALQAASAPPDNGELELQSSSHLEYFLIYLVKIENRCDMCICFRTEGIVYNILSPISKKCNSRFYESTKST